MLKLVVIADDFTGALDTGIKFAKEGIQTQVMLNSDFLFSQITSDCTVLVVDVETRHLKREEAYRIVYILVKRCINKNVKYIYKKTDSALRGCIGSELAALIDATGRDVEFIPALPKEKRITKEGIQYINGVPVSKSIFGMDPFEPVKHSKITDIIHEETNKEVIIIKRGEKVSKTTLPSIVVYDATTEMDIKNIARALYVRGRLGVMAGCSGFATCLPEILHFQKNSVKESRHTRSVFIVCGSVNAIAVKQLIYAQNKGFRRISLTSRQKLQPDYLDSLEGKEFLHMFEMECRKETPVILDGFLENAVEETAHYAESIGLKQNSIRVAVAKRIGSFVRKWLEFKLDDTLVITGGDTVYAFLMQIKCNDIEPICETMPGVVLFNLKTETREVQVVSKSGGFGNERLLVEIADKIIENGGNKNE